MGWKRVQARLRASNRAGSTRGRVWGPSLQRRRACAAGSRLRLSPPARPVRHRLPRAGRWESRGTELRRRHDTYAIWSAMRPLPRSRPDLAAARLRVQWPWIGRSGEEDEGAGPEETRRIPVESISALLTSPNDLTASMSCSLLAALRSKLRQGYLWKAKNSAFHSIAEHRAEVILRFSLHHY
jgi:hypothetical protein